MMTSGAAFVAPELSQTSMKHCLKIIGLKRTG